MINAEAKGWAERPIEGSYTEQNRGRMDTDTRGELIGGK
jgi:hypothetical protein